MVGRCQRKGRRMFRVLGFGRGLLLLIVALSGVGCKQHYNGSFGIGADQYEMVKDYHRAREERLIAQEKATAPRSRSVRISQTGVIPPQQAPVDLTQPSATEPVILSSEQPAPHTQQASERPVGQGGITLDSYENYTSRQHYVSNDSASSNHIQIPQSVSPYGTIPGERGVISPLDSTGQLRRISFTSEGADFDVTVDNAGDFLIYSSTRHRQTADIYRQRIDGSAITQLTDDASNDVMATLSPDGKTMAFTSDRSGNWDIYLMDANGGPAVQLTSDAAHDIHPSFSPDGKKLVYCSLGKRSGQWELVTVDVANPTTKRYIGHGLFPQWSPTTQTILYQRARERGTRWFSVWTVALDEGGEAGSPTEIVWSSEFACITPSWSPDGKAVVFCTVTNPEADTQGDRPAESDVWIARDNGSGRTRLTRGRFANLQPVWSGDNTIYFVSNRATGGVENIWALDPDDAIKVAFPGFGDKETQAADVPTESD